MQKLFGSNAGTDYLKNTFGFGNALDAGQALKVAASAVRTKDGDVVLKYVNTLDRPVSVTVTLENGKGIPAAAKRTVLTGSSFTGKDYTLTDSYIKLGENFIVNLPAHSMTVIRF